MANHRAASPNGYQDIWSFLSDGFQYAAVVYTIGPISGGHCNPSVTFSMFLANRLSLKATFGFIFSQVMGAMLAAPMQLLVTSRQIHIGPQEGVHWWQAMATELTYTAMIVFVYLNCAASPRSNPKKDPNGYTGLAMGLAFCAGRKAGQNISGAVLNPAIAFGLQWLPVMRTGEVQRNWGMAYLPYEMAASLVAVGFYKLVRQGEESGEDAANISLKRENHWLAESPMSAKVTAEFLGTFFLITTKGLMAGSAAGDAGAPLAVSSVLAAMIYSVRGISGAHFNPAVSTAVWLSGRGLLSLTNVLPYVFTQLLAGVAASLLFTALLEDGTDRFGFGIHGGDIAAQEVAFTFLLSYSQLATSTVHPIGSISRQNNIAGLTVGGTLLVGGVAVSNLSGGIMNPALALSVSGSNIIADGVNTFAYTGIYAAFEICGGALASCAFFVTHAHVYRALWEQELREQSYEPVDEAGSDEEEGKEAAE
eukprot:CAMPEP_0178408642 /NCGR_PEP_ID=MMETSP0689_2-20121128/20048_1 /TAXON_ID=160604 /ORGANISM="Amphidinium massartii, Strain CS-259" /LENGTH=478 /DNA_ID=CAMNT_0020029751 /DNA_START=180 /DNA_END=1616 /DNA_ORIENTATION=+